MPQTCYRRKSVSILAEMSAHLICLFITDISDIDVLSQVSNQILTTEMVADYDISGGVCGAP